MRYGTLRSDFMRKPVKLGTRRGTTRRWNNIARNKGNKFGTRPAKSNRIRVMVANNLHRLSRHPAPRNTEKSRPRYQFQEYLDALKQEEFQESTNAGDRSKIQKKKPIGNVKVAAVSRTARQTQVSTEIEQKTELRKTDVMEIDQDNNPADEVIIGDTEERQIRLVKTIPLRSMLTARLPPVRTSIKRNSFRTVGNTKTRNTQDHRNKSFQPSARLFWNSVQQ